MNPGTYIRDMLRLGAPDVQKTKSVCACLEHPVETLRFKQAAVQYEMVKRLRLDQTSKNFHVKVGQLDKLGLHMYTHFDITESQRAIFVN